MQIFKGIPVSSGYAEGNAYVCSPDWSTNLAVPRYRVEDEDIEAEKERLHAAIRDAGIELENIHGQIKETLGQVMADIFAVHLMILKDERFGDKVMRHIERERVNVEQAFMAEISAFNKHLARSNQFFRERMNDIRDVGLLVMRHLTKSEGKRLSDLPPGSVVIATDLLPSDTISLIHYADIAVVTEHGGETSHLAILARAAGIPTVSGVEGIVRAAKNGERVLVDGDHGEVVLSPEPDYYVKFKQAREKYCTVAAQVESEEQEAAVTLDGCQIQIYANIGYPGEGQQVVKHNLAGVGLLRTELCFLDELKPPDVEQQVQVYQRAADIIKGKPLTIRVFDLGGDKKPKFLPPKFDGTQTMGMRGLQFLLFEKSLLQTQLQAILEVSRYRAVRIMFPMVFDAEDFEQALGIVKEIAGKISVAQPPVGAMIEMPSALFMLDEITEKADFLSIGTNDLVQYLLAGDREASVINDESVLHPAVVRALAAIVDAGRDYGKPVSVCGEAAGQVNTAVLLLGLGIRELSVSPTRAAALRRVIRQTDSRKAEEMASLALSCRTISQVERLVYATGEFSVLHNHNGYRH